MLEGMPGRALTSPTLTAPLGRQPPGGPPASSQAPVCVRACILCVCVCESILHKAPLKKLFPSRKAAYFLTDACVCVCVCAFACI